MNLLGMIFSMCGLMMKVRQLQTDGIEDILVGFGRILIFGSQMIIENYFLKPRFSQ